MHKVSAAEGRARPPRGSAQPARWMVLCSFRPQTRERERERDREIERRGRGRDFAVLNVISSHWFSGARGCPRIGQLSVTCKARAVINARVIADLRAFRLLSTNDSFTSTGEFSLPCSPSREFMLLENALGLTGFLSRSKSTFTISSPLVFVSEIHDIYSTSYKYL